MTGRAAHDRLYRERHRDTIVVRDRERRRAKAEASGCAKRLRACDDDDRGLRRLLLDLGLSAPPPTPQRTVERLQWHRAGAARTPVLVAVVRLPSTTEQWATQQDQDGRDRPRRCNDNVWRQG